MDKKEFWLRDVESQLFKRLITAVSSDVITEYSVSADSLQKRLLTAGPYTYAPVYINEYKLFINLVKANKALREIDIQRHENKLNEYIIECNIQKVIKDKDALSVKIDRDTRTIDLMDSFEGLEKSDKRYKYIVTLNAYQRWIDKEKRSYRFHLIIERGNFYDCAVGGITFTQFKSGNTEDLMQHIDNEIMLADKDELVRGNVYMLNKPYRLNAQNSRNRTGYGDRWEWYYGTAVYHEEGTKYGETTSYIFAGILLA